MNNWKFAFLLIAGIILIGFGILMFDVIENDCTLKREDWRYRLITFTTSLIIGFGFFGLIVYTTYVHLEDSSNVFTGFDFSKERRGVVSAMQILIGVMLVVYGPTVMQVTINECDLDVSNWRQILINGIAFLSTVVGLFLIVKPFWNRLAATKEIDYLSLLSETDTTSDTTSRRGSRASRRRTNPATSTTSQAGSEPVVQVWVDGGEYWA